MSYLPDLCGGGMAPLAPASPYFREKFEQNLARKHLRSKQHRNHHHHLHSVGGLYSMSPPYRHDVANVSPIEFSSHPLVHLAQNLQSVPSSAPQSRPSAGLLAMSSHPPTQISRRAMLFRLKLQLQQQQDSVASALDIDGESTTEAQQRQPISSLLSLQEHAAHSLERLHAEARSAAASLASSTDALTADLKAMIARDVSTFSEVVGHLPVNLGLAGAVSSFVQLVRGREQHLRNAAKRFAEASKRCSSVIAAMQNDLSSCLNQWARSISAIVSAGGLQQKGGVQIAGFLTSVQVQREELSKKLEETIRSAVDAWSGFPARAEKIGSEFVELVSALSKDGPDVIVVHLAVERAFQRWNADFADAAVSCHASCSESFSRLCGLMHDVATSEADTAADLCKSLDALGPGPSAPMGDNPFRPATAPAHPAVPLYREVQGSPALRALHHATLAAVLPAPGNGIAPNSTMSFAPLRRSDVLLVITFPRAPPNPLPRGYHIGDQPGFGSGGYAQASRSHSQQNLSPHQQLSAPRLGRRSSSCLDLGLDALQNEPSGGSVSPRLRGILAASECSSATSCSPELLNYCTEACSVDDECETDCAVEDECEADCAVEEDEVEFDEEITESD